MNKSLLFIGGSDIDYFYEVENFPVAGDGCLSRFKGQKVGGCVVNAGCVASSYGAAVRMLDTLKESDEGTELIVSALREHGVDTSFIRYGKDVVNGNCLIMEHDGEKIIFVCQPSYPVYEDDERLAELLGEADYVYTLMHIVRSSFTDLKPLLKARQKGTRFIFDGSSQYNDPEEIEILKQLASGLFINKTAYGRLCAKAGCDFKDYLLAHGAEFVCLTDGSRGAECHTAEGSWHCDSVKIQVKDSTGAGDTFAGSFLAFRQKGYDWPKCLSRASLAAAYACTVEGGLGGCSNEKELIKWQKKNLPDYVERVSAI